MGSIGIMVVYIAFFGVMIYFMAIRPQKKEQKRMAAMLSTMETGDYVVTTAGFYGCIVAITEDTVIVEFGNDKHCRIPMEKTAIKSVEHAE